MAAKHACSSATQLINASGGANKYNTNTASQSQLVGQCKTAADQIPKLVQGIKGTMNAPDSPGAQLNLINAAQNMLGPGGKLITCAKGAVTTVSDPSAAMGLSNAAKTMAAALAELRNAMGKVMQMHSSIRHNCFNVLCSWQMKYECYASK